MRMNFSLLDALNERVNLSEQKGVNLSERYSRRVRLADLGLLVPFYLYLACLLPPLSVFFYSIVAE